MNTHQIPLKLFNNPNTTTMENYRFTFQERNAVFTLADCKTQLEAARRCNISLSKLEKMLRELRKKTACKSNYALIDKIYAENRSRDITSS